MPIPRWARGVSDGISAAGIRDVVYVPDNPLSHILRDIGGRLPEVRLILATREEEACGIAAGLYLGGRRPGVLLQSSGLGNSLNAITSLAIPYRIPMLLVISMRGEAGEWNAAQAPMGQALRAILDAIAIPHTTIESDAGVAERVRAAAAAAFDARLPGACLLARRLTSAA